MPRPSADVLSLLTQGGIALANERKATKGDLDAAVASQKAADQVLIDAKTALLVKANDAIATLTATNTDLQAKLDAATVAAQTAADQVPDLVAAAVQAFVGTVLAGNTTIGPPAESGEVVVGG